MIAKLTAGSDNLAVPLTFGFVHYPLHHDFAPFLKYLVADEIRTVFEACICRLSG